MSVNNIVNKIIEDAKKIEEEIVNKAVKHSEEIKESKDKEIDSLIKENKTKAEREGISKKERLIQNAHLQVRNNKLRAKQDVIQKLFDKSLDELNALSDEDFKVFVKNTLSNVSIEKDGVVVLNSKRHKVVTPEFIKEVNSNLTLAEADDSIKDGFVVKVDNVYYNFTFKSILEGLKSELTSEVVKTLF